MVNIAQAEYVGGFAFIFVVLFLLIAGVLTILMPFMVFFIWDNLRTIRRLLQDFERAKSDPPPPPMWRLKGVHRETGRPQVVEVRARDEASAVGMANARKVMVQSAELT